MNYRLSNFNIYKGESELFLSNGDHYLLRISGEDSIKLEAILQEFKKPSSAEDAFTNLKIQIDKDQFNNLVSWLVGYNILLKEENNSEDIGTLNKNVTIWGDFDDLTEVNEKIIKRLSGEKIRYSSNSIIYNEINESQLEDSDFVIIFSPIFGNYSAFQKLNKLCYKKKIPMLHLGTGMNFVTIGPFSIPDVQTPCLECYSKRKMINLDNKSKYLKFIKLSDQKVIKNNDLFKNQYFGIMIEYLKVELENFFLRKNMYLYARSITIDFLNHDISESRILKIPYCKICDESTVVAPLN